MIGIDVSKDKIDACLVSDKTREQVWHKVFARDEKGIGQLLKATAPDEALVIEPTGRYSHLVAKLAMDQNRTALLAPTRQSKAFRASIQTRAKTDKIDSYGLACFGLSRPLARYPIKPDNVEEIDQLLTARIALVDSRTRLRMQAKELTAAKASLEAVIAELSVQIKQIERKLRQVSKTDPDYAAVKELARAPGIGILTAVSVVSCLCAKRFTDPDQFVAYVGLDISIQQSGKRKGELGLTKQGHAELRRLLYLAAQSNLRCKSSPYKDQYYREREKGLKHTAAACAVARKLARLCWSLHKHGSKYDAARVNRQAVRPASDACAPAAPETPSMS